MTLNYDVHYLFDTLKLWLEAVNGISNTYEIKTTSEFSEQFVKMLHIPSHITFEYFRTRLPLPNPEYLRIHAFVCKVAHMSGAADYIDDLYRKMERTDVLAEDGSSMDILHRLDFSHVVSTFA
ncbi:hypothetical protein GYMLUDRAFT_219103 [Collybiopsis luxurians FD-317 M1]|nr:hypothetical protein GYMLUDRAFT_219103 [Collybiopsis luxurians FD-317 M1]